MTAPVNNANFTTPASQTTRQPTARQGGSADASTGNDGAARTDSVSLSGRATEATAESSIRSLGAAREAIERIKQLLGDDPGAAVAAFRGLDANTAAGALRTAA